MCEGEVECLHTEVEAVGGDIAMIWMEFVCSICYQVNSIRNSVDFDVRQRDCLDPNVFNIGTKVAKITNRVRFEDFGRVPIKQNRISSVKVNRH